MCEFCENKKPLLLELQQLRNGIFRVQCFINHGVLDVSVMLPLNDCDTMLYTKSIDTYFCPMCGRKLSEV